MADSPSPDSPRRPGRPRKAGGRDRNRYALRSGDAWWTWFAELAQAVSEPKAKIIEAALAEYAARRGFRPPPRRGD